jgi:hypothetical protein
MAVAGGDGTVDAAANGLRQSPLPLALLPRPAGREPAGAAVQIDGHVALRLPASLRQCRAAARAHPAGKARRFPRKRPGATIVRPNSR